MARSERFVPSDDDVRFFRENGYWIAPRFLDDRRLEALRGPYGPRVRRPS